MTHRHGEHIPHRSGCVFKNVRLMHCTWFTGGRGHTMPLRGTAARAMPRNHFHLHPRTTVAFVCQRRSVNCDKREELKTAGLDGPLLHMDTRLLTCFYGCLFMHLCQGNTVKQKAEGNHFLLGILNHKIYILQQPSCQLSLSGTASHALHCFKVKFVSWQVSLILVEISPRADERCFTPWP